jgi:hypothetical protein
MRLPLHILPLLVFVVVVLAARPAAAILVFRRGSDRPVAGFLVSQDADRIVIREELPDGKSQIREILRADVEDVIVTVDQQRLEALDPEQPNAYRDYAEELAEKRRDPEARETSRRLYVIAAYLAPQELGRSCLLGMANLARGPAEERKYRAMAYLLDPQHDRGLLRRPLARQGPAAEAEDEGRELVLKAVRAMRRGDRRIVLNLIKSPSFKPSFQHWSDDITYEEFISLPEEIPPAKLLQVLRLELALSRSNTGDETEADRSEVAWARIVQQGGDAPVPALSLVNICEYDPRKCLFRAGQWRRTDE